MTEEMICDNLLGVHTGRQKRIQQQSDRDGEDLVPINFPTRAYISVQINQSKLIAIPCHKYGWHVTYLR